MTWHHITSLYIQTKPNKHTYSTCMNTCITLHCITQMHTHTNTHTHTAALFCQESTNTAGWKEPVSNQYRLSRALLHQLRALGSSHAETQGGSPAQGARREPTPATHWLSHLSGRHQWNGIAPFPKRRSVQTRSQARNHRRNASEEVELTARCGQN